VKQPGELCDRMISGISSVGSRGRTSTVRLPLVAQRPETHTVLLV